MKHESTILGVKFVVSEHVMPIPVLQISPDFEWCTDTYRAKHNAWLLERFGTYDPVFLFANNPTIVSPETMARMKQAVMLRGAT